MAVYNDPPKGFTALFSDFYKHLPTGIVVKKGEEESEWTFVNVTEQEFRDAYLAETKQQVNLIRDFEIYWSLFALPKDKNYVLVTDPEVKEVLNKRVVICSGCSKFCGSSAAGPTFKDHYKTGQGCLEHMYDHFECLGDWLNSTRNRRRVFIVTDAKGQSLNDNDTDEGQLQEEEVNVKIPEGSVVIGLSNEEEDGETPSSPVPQTLPQPLSQNQKVEEPLTFNIQEPQVKEASSNEEDSESTLVEPEKSITSLTPAAGVEAMAKLVEKESQKESSGETKTNKDAESEVLDPDIENEKTTVQENTQGEAPSAFMIHREAIQALIESPPNEQVANNSDDESPINESAFFDPVRNLSPTEGVAEALKGSQLDLNSQTIDPQLLSSDRVTPPQPEVLLAIAAVGNSQVDQDDESSDDDSVELLSVEDIDPPQSGVRTRSITALPSIQAPEREISKPVSKGKAPRQQPKKTQKAQTQKSQKAQKAQTVQKSQKTKLPPFPRIIVDAKYKTSTPREKGATASASPNHKRITRSESQLSSPSRPKRNASLNPTTDDRMNALTSQKPITGKTAKEKTPTKKPKGKRTIEDALAEEQKKKKAKKAKDTNEVSNNDEYDVPLPPNHTDANFNLETWKLMSTSFETFRLGIIDNINNELLDNINQYPTVIKAYENYFKNAHATTYQLPYVLLDCITDDLWNADEEIRDNFRFTLNGGDSPSISVYNDSTPYSFPVTMALKSSGGEKGWSFSLKIDMCHKLTTSGGFGHSYNINADELDYAGICEMLMNFRVVIYTVTYRLARGMDVLEMTSLCQFVSQAFEKVRSGDVATRMVDEKLYSHIARWKK